eukprot:TRINITY_DN5166_c0_g1_i1.p1 TRINITY_DN5166_c0_g1~~TRINITY_DN5166_c0_g1_i1.p1  ORF type:complete len:239 (-),score=60.96 TRINITY_DN5166_c0_g1_i1:51-767(-)
MKNETSVLDAEAAMPIQRVHEGLLHRYERQLLWWCAAYMPEWLTPDKLTIGGLLASIVIGIAYCMSWRSLWGFPIASIFLVVHWYCDSMDGTIARYRDRCRPSYGQFVDIFVDNLSMFCWFVPLGYSPAINDPRIGFMLCIAFYLIVIKVAYQDAYENKHVISMGQLSGTEGRIGLVGLNTLYFLFPTPLVSLFLWFVVSVIMLVMVVYSIYDSSMLAWRLRVLDERALAERLSQASS